MRLQDMLNCHLPKDIQFHLGFLKLPSPQKAFLFDLLPLTKQLGFS